MNAMPWPHISNTWQPFTYMYSRYRLVLNVTDPNIKFYAAPQPDFKTKFSAKNV